jgi:hypothetical protein
MLYRVQSVGLFHECETSDKISMEARGLSRIFSAVRESGAEVVKRVISRPVRALP